MASATVDPEAHPLSPAILPFAVRTPYLNVWHALVAGDLSPDTHETATSVGWDGLVAVDGTFYVWLSDFEVAAWTRNASVKQTQVTPTRTILTITTGPVELTVTFLSPIEPGNWVRQSIPFTYVAVDVNSLDGATHSVQLYSAIGGEWNSADWGQNITWQTTRTPYSIYHSSTLLNPTPYKEDSMALWGSVHYAIKKDSSVTAMTGLGPTVQGVFEGNRELDNSQDTQFRQIGTFSRFALAQDLGAITKTQNPVVWALGANRDPAILYTDISGQGQPRSFYFNSNSTLSASTDALVDDVLADYPNALTRATQLDQRILSAANSISSNYADLVSQATRQAFGATELTIAKGSDGSWNTSDVMMFMKGFGGSVDTNRVNAVETLYASFPVFMFVDPTLGAPLLEPLLRFQTSDFYTNDYAAKDLGSDYPKATGNNTSHSYGVEHTSSMIIMAYAHARTTGDGSLLKRYYTLLRKWADYLTANSMPIKDQLSADDDSFDSQTNLAIKGIIAVEAMSRISTALDEKDDAVNYDSQAKSLLSQWKATALGSDNHLLASLGAANSYTLGYNLFADQWLGTGLIDSSIIDAHTKFLGNMMTAGPNTSYGVANDNYNVTFTANSAWNMFAAATVSDGKVRDQLIAGIHQAASYTPNSSIAAFPLIYNSVNGSVISGSGR
ncbi:hypothetical protein FA95DRAFT_1489040 [Auriscalpium vulgare]|uniref:Uncharacterized protein n=1 Tax=Auriscalpium vulgare TaxID=40419 RepID=A0ACB8RZ05_9AGAM|nr:hypothetical protein FA95DRAFT_1489040 [Auriscalpium vulgare]